MHFIALFDLEFWWLMLRELWFLLAFPFFVGVFVGAVCARRWT